MTGSWDASVFDRIYRERADPWQVETSAYEREKYARTLAAAPPGPVARGLEVGCSIGAQTRLLAARCVRLLALDISAEAVRLARRNCRDLPDVEICEARVPRDWPAGRFGLMVFSEVLYFLDRDDLARTASLAVDSLEAGGTIVLVNWTGETDTPLTGDGAAEGFIAGCAPRLRLVAAERRPCYRVDVLARGEEEVLF
jgi:SAM-dependent methyltransferase